MKETVIGNFVSKLLLITESSKPYNDALNTYLDFLVNETNFASQNFDYILQDYKKGDLFKREEWEKVTEQQHHHILTVIEAIGSNLAGTLCYIVAGVGEVTGSTESGVKALLPRKEYKNTFPFSEIRGTQEAIFAKMDELPANEDITDIIIDAPTGCGKSPIAIASLLKEYSGYLCTANKALQDQYLSEFSWLSDLRGKSNYRCNVHDGYDCSSSPCNKSKQSRRECRENFGRCDYGTAKSRALSDSKFSLLNMHTLISYAVYVPDQISPRDMLIIDEAHSFPEVMSSSVGLSLSLKALTPFGVNSIPKYANASKYDGFLQDVLERIQEDEEALTEENEQMVHKIKYIKSQLHSGNLSVDHEMNQQDAQLVERLKMFPVKVEEYYNKIRKLAPIRIHLSATILGYETYCNMLGIDQKNVAIIRTSSPFPKEIRPVYLNYSVGQMNAKSLPIIIPQLINRIEYLMDHYKDYKGMIHGVTYHLCNQIYSGIRQDLRARLLFARSSREQNECLSRHRESKNTVLLSPSMTEGIDLKDDHCRFQIIAKTPYPYLGDPLLQLRKEIYPGYYEMLTATTVMQAYGRATRHSGDWSHTYIMDDSFKYFVQRNPGLFPKWFLEAITW
jgi:ATP-dependent DNA helicase DinG